MSSAVEAAVGPAAAKTFLITGATSGIGLALAEHLHRSPVAHRLILVGRQPLDASSDPSAEGPPPTLNDHNYCQVDLAEPDAAAEIDRWCQSRGIDAIDVVIHNAGVGWTGPLWTQPTSTIDDMVAVNLTAPIALTQQLLPRVQAASGRFVFVSSIMSTVASPDMAVYVATKKALDGFVRSLRAERSIGDVTLQVVHPGATRTAMPDKVGVDPDVSKRWRSAESVAAELLDGLDSAASNRALGLPNRAIRKISRRVPGPVAAIVAGGRSTPPDPPASGGSPRALITGAADGIGRALALHYANQGFQVVGVDIDRERAVRTADEAPGERVEFRHVDLTTSDMAWVQNEAPFDVVVHNAGVSAVGPFAEISAERHQKVIDLNLTAPMLLTRELVAQAKLTAGARIVLISSLSHQMSYPGAAVYAATKDGLELYGRALHGALRPAARVTTVFPGPTRTAHAARYSPDNTHEARRMDPAKLAELIVATDRRRLIPGAPAKVSAALGVVSPSAGEAIMRKTVYAKLHGKALQS